MSTTNGRILHPAAWGHTFAALQTPINAVGKQVSGAPAAGSAGAGSCRQTRSRSRRRGRAGAWPPARPPPARPRSPARFPLICWPHRLRPATQGQGGHAGCRGEKVRALSMGASPPGCGPGGDSAAGVRGTPLPPETPAPAPAARAPGLVYSLALGARMQTHTKLGWLSREPEPERAAPESFTVDATWQPQVCRASSLVSSSSSSSSTSHISTGACSITRSTRNRCTPAAAACTGWQQQLCCSEQRPQQCLLQRAPRLSTASLPSGRRECRSMRSSVPIAAKPPSEFIQHCGTHCEFWLSQASTRQALWIEPCQLQLALLTIPNWREPHQGLSYCISPSSSLGARKCQTPSTTEGASAVSRPAWSAPFSAGQQRVEQHTVPAGACWSRSARLRTCTGRGATASCMQSLPGLEDVERDWSRGKGDHAEREDWLSQGVREQPQSVRNKGQMSEDGHTRRHSRTRSLLLAVALSTARTRRLRLCLL